jgi:hypothetical protein
MQHLKNDDTVEGLLGRIQALSDTVKTPEQVEQYLNEQPQAPAKGSFDETFNKLLDLQMFYVRVPPFVLKEMKNETNIALYYL